MEILITLFLLGVLFVPAMQLFSYAMEGTHISKDLFTAMSLARWQMERIKNFSGGSVQRLKTLGNGTWPPDGEPAFSLNGKAWRVDRSLVDADAGLVEVRVAVRRDGESKEQVHLVTQIADTSWGPQA